MRSLQLPDFHYTQSHLVERLKFAAEHLIPFGVLCIQLDQLDDLTATHGLEAAEAILNVVAHTLRNGLDPLDFLGRWSEDQFLAIVANCSESDLLTTAERLKRLAESSEIVWWGDQLSVTVSVGGTSLGTVARPRPTLGPGWQSACNRLLPRAAISPSCFRASETPVSKER